MFKILGAAVAAIALAAAGSASAAVIASFSGGPLTSPPEGRWGIPRNNAHDFGTIELRWTSSAPVVFHFLQIYDYEWDEYTRETKYTGGTGFGNESYFLIDHTADVAATSGTFRFRPPAMEREGDGLRWIIIDYKPERFGAWFAGPAGGVDWTLVVSTVPEPTTWAMMIAGFMGVGSAARFKRTRRLA